VERVKAYVDGFNLYHGLKTRHGRKYLWPDLLALAVRLLKPSQHLVAVEYFTARVRNQAESGQRQAVYLDDLAAHCPLVKVVQGRFQKKSHACRSCGGQWVPYVEKERCVPWKPQTASAQPSASSLCFRVSTLQTQRRSTEGRQRHDQG